MDEAKYGDSDDDIKCSIRKQQVLGLAFDKLQLNALCRCVSPCSGNHLRIGVKLPLDAQARMRGCHPRRTMRSTSLIGEMRLSLR